MKLSQILITERFLGLSMSNWWVQLMINQLISHWLVAIING